MSRSRAEAQFLRFQKKGHADDLAAVFDLTAPELLRVASHLTQDLHAAEDLVQATFLAAIQHRDRYEPRSSVVAWLTGILVNRAHMLRRERARQPDPERLDHNTTQNPQKIAQGQELSEAVSDAIAALPEIYRPVLNLHLRNGLNAREIALALERSPGTVRTQIMRGMEILRRALPAGLAIGAVAGPAATPGLASIRAVVMKAGAKATPATASTAAALGGILIMKNLMMVASGLIAASALTWMLWPKPALTPQESQLELPAAQFARVETPATSANPASVRETLEGASGSARQELDVPPTLATTPTVTLHGRCVDADTGEPLGNCEIELDGSPNSQDRLQAYERTNGKVAWNDPDELRSGPDGVFSFTFVSPPPYGYRLNIHREGRVSMTGLWSNLKPGTIVDVGDVFLSTGCMVTGRVTDTAGVPQGGISVSLQGESPSLDGIHARSHAFGQTRPDGTFALPDRIPPGNWRLSVSGRQLVEPARAILVPEDPNPVLDVVVRRVADIQTITGVVIDERGLPVPSASVTFGDHANGPSSSGRTRRDGTFMIEKRRGEVSEEVIFVEKLGYEFLVTEDTYAWGASNVTLTLSEAKSVEVLALDAETGNPVEEYGIRCYVDPLESGRLSSIEVEIQQQGRHEGGLARIRGVRKGTNLLVIEPLGTKYFQSRVQLFKMTEGGAPRQIVRLRPTIQAMLEVVTPEGRPVQGSSVELVRTPDEAPLPLQERPSPLGNMFQGDIAMVLHQGQTDESGRVTLAAPGGEKMALRLLGPGHEPVTVNGFVLDPLADQHRVVVPNGATLQVRVGPPSVVGVFVPDTPGKPDSRPPGIRLVRPYGDPKQFPLDRSSVPLDEDGAVEVMHLPKGSWDLLFTHGNTVGRTHHMLTIENLAEGETRSVEVDIGRFAPGTVHARLFLNGEPLRDANVTPYGILVNSKGEEENVYADRQSTTASGRVSFVLVPATYTLHASIYSSTSRQWVNLPAPPGFVVSPGGEADHVLHIQTGRARIRVLASDKHTPIEGLLLRAQDRNGRSAGTATTDADGWALFEHIPLEPIQLWTYPRDLAGSSAQINYRLRTGKDPERIDLISIRARGIEQENVAELVMPAESGY